MGNKNSCQKPNISDDRIRDVLHQLGEGKHYRDIKDKMGVLYPSGTINKVKKWYNSIGWNEAKVYTGGGETVLQARKDYWQKKGEEYAVQFLDKALEKHFDDLVQTTEALASNINKLVKVGCLETYRRLILEAGGIGFNIASEEFGSMSTKHPGGAITVTLVDREKGKPIRERSSETEEVNEFLANGLLKHFNQEFPELALNDWKEIVSEKASMVVDGLCLLAYSKAFKLCPSCKVCQKLYTLPDSVHKISTI